MECIVLAGGFGTRLQSVVNDVPKCLAPIRGVPFLAYLLRYLEQEGVTHVIFSLGYKHELVEEWLSGYTSGLQISIAVEHEPLGTGGAIQYAMQHATEPDILVVNGDTLFSLPLVPLFEVHRQNQYMATLGLKPMENFDRYGTVAFNGRFITEFHEKQFCIKGLINGGVFVLRKDALDNMPQKFSLEQDFLMPLAPQKSIGGYVDDAYFIDIGIPSDYEKAQYEIAPLI